MCSRRFAETAAALAVAVLLAGCMPDLALPGSGPQAPSTVTVTVNTTVNGVPAESSTREGVSVDPSAGAPDTQGPASGQAGTAPVQGGRAPASGEVAEPVDPERAAAIDRAVQALTPLGDVERGEVCAVMCPGPDAK